MEKEEKKSLEGVVKNLSEVHTYRKGKKLYILHCNCLRTGLWGETAGGKGRDFPRPISDQLYCPRCQLYPWMMCETMYQSGMRK